MTERIVYVSRIVRLPLVGSDGSDVGHVVDVVLDLGGRPPGWSGSWSAACSAAGCSWP